MSRIPKFCAHCAEVDLETLAELYCAKTHREGSRYNGRENVEMRLRDYLKEHPGPHSYADLGRALWVTPDAIRSAIKRAELPLEFDHIDGRKIGKKGV